jgi:ribosome recycling factor
MNFIKSGRQARITGGHMEDLKFYEDKMNKTLDVLVSDYAAIRAGRANPHVLDKIRVDYYGTPTPIQQVGNVSVPEARMIVIQPWEKSLLKAIEKAILTSELGINPTNDGNCIRLVFPEMTEDRRKEVAKDVKKKGDGAKVAIRNIRRDANDALKKAEKAGDMSEDELAETTEKMQKLTDKMVERVDKLVEEKTKEIMTV